MNNKFGEFLYSLRKERGITQAELADRLGITNKAVSKWETGEAFPETGQLVPLSTFFNITVDELLRGERNPDIQQITLPETKQEDVVPKLKPITKAETYAIAGAIGIIFLGIITLITLSINDIRYNIYVPIFLAAVAVAVVILTYVSCKRKIRSADITPDEARKGEWIALLLSCGIGVLVVSVALLIGLTYNLPIRVILPIFISILFVGVTVIILAGIQWGNFAKTFDLPKDENPLQGRAKKLEDMICGTVMLSATAIFLIMGFLYYRWHPGWVVFPIGGVICAIVSTILKGLQK